MKQKSRFSHRRHIRQWSTPTVHTCISNIEGKKSNHGAIIDKYNDPCNIQDYYQPNVQVKVYQQLSTKKHRDHTIYMQTRKNRKRSTLENRFYGRNKCRKKLYFLSCTKRIILIYKQSKSDTVYLKLPTSYQFICCDTWEVGYQIKPFQKGLLDRTLHDGPPSSVGSELRCCDVPCGTTVSAAVVPRMVPPGALLA